MAKLDLHRPELRSRILADETLFGIFADLASPLAAELCGQAGLDWVLVDLEHGEGTEADLLQTIYAIETTSAAAIVRPQSGERLRIGRALDLGAAGIMIPRMDSADETRTTAMYLRYPPRGSRGVALRTRGARLGTVAHDSVSTIDESVVGIVQIESIGALRQADEIAAIDGVDVLFVGPTDLSHALGVPGRFDDDSYGDALRAVLKACSRHHKAPGILLYDEASVARHLELGFRFVGIGANAAFVANGTRDALKSARRAASTD